MIALVVSARGGFAAFTTFESGQVRPLAISPDGTRLFAVNTPDDQLEIFSVAAGTGALAHQASVPVGLEPVAVTAIVPSVERALDVLTEGEVDVAVLDINLLGASVVPLAEYLRARGVPFLFLTGYGTGELLPEHLRGHPRLDKPVDAERLVRAMLDLVRRDG